MNEIFHDRSATILKFLKEEISDRRYISDCQNINYRDCCSIEVISLKIVFQRNVETTFQALLFANHEAIFSQLHGFPEAQMDLMIT